MLSLKTLLKSKTFFIPACSYFGIIVLLFIGAVLESQKILLPTNDMGGLCIWALIFASLPIAWLLDFLDSVTHYTLESLVLVFSLALMFVYHLVIGFGLGFLTNFIYRRLKSRKPLDIDKTNESPDIESSKQALSHRKFFSRKIVLIILGIVLGLITITTTVYFIYEDKYTLDDTAFFNSCADITKELLSDIKSANYCKTDDECVTLDESHINCSSFVNQNELVSLQNKITFLVGSCPGIIKACPVFLSNPYLACKNNRCDWAEDQEHKIVVQTDKKIYQQSENIIVTLTNNFATPIKITNEEYISGGVADLERKTDSGWQKTNLAVLPHELSIKELLPGKSHNYRWDQNLRMIESPGPMPPGIYRFKFTFDQMGAVYSNEFEIKEQLIQAGFDLSSPKLLAKAYIEISNNKDFNGFRSLHHPQLRKYLEQNSPNYFEMTFKPTLIRENPIPFSAEILIISDFEQRLPEYWYYNVVPTHKFTVQYDIEELKRTLEVVTIKTEGIEEEIAKFGDKWYLVFGIPKYLMKKNGEECGDDYECQTINCSKYDTSEKEGYKPYCVDDKCKCMCYGCK